MLKKKIICFDIDGVICTTDKSNYHKAKPKKKVIKLINNLFENKWDLSTFIEYHNDDRNNDSTDIFQNDLFLATRLNFNDTDGT